MHVDDDPTILGWIRAQTNKGAIIIGICSGAHVLGKAGLLNGRKLTGHWYDRGDLPRSYPTASYMSNKRYLVDRGVATTTGITASMPTALALVEAIGGRERAMALAEELGLASWDPAHDSARFKLSAGRVWTVVTNTVAFWQHEQVSIQVQDGIDDVQLAFAVDAWSRTRRASVVAVADSTAPVRLRSGLTLMPIADPATAANMRSLSRPAMVKPAQQLDRTLCEIGQRHGVSTRDWVALEMEYPVSNWAAGDCFGSPDHD